MQIFKVLRIKAFLSLVFNPTGNVPAQKCFDVGPLWILILPTGEKQIRISRLIPDGLVVISICTA